MVEKRWVKVRNKLAIFIIVRNIKKKWLPSLSMLRPG